MPNETPSQVDRANYLAVASAQADVEGRREGGGSHRYDDHERAVALACLAANGGNLRRTSLLLHIPTTVLKRWSQDPRYASVQRMAVCCEEILADMCADLFPELLERIEEKMREAPLKDLIHALSVLTDKFLLLKGAPTSIHRRETEADPLAEMPDHELAAFLASFLARHSAGSPPVDAGARTVPPVRGGQGPGPGLHE